jgi:hypothetical protein
VRGARGVAVFWTTRQWCSFALGCTTSGGDKFLDSINYAGILSATGTPLTGQLLPPSTPPHDVAELGVASDGSEYLLVWVEPVAGMTNAYVLKGELRNDDFTVRSSPFAITPTSSYKSRIVATVVGGQYVVAWIEWGTTTTPGNAVRVARVTPGGMVLDPGGVVVATDPSAVTVSAYVSLVALGPTRAIAAYEGANAGPGNARLLTFAPTSVEDAGSEVAPPEDAGSDTSDGGSPPGDTNANPDVIADAAVIETNIEPDAPSMDAGAEPDAGTTDSAVPADAAELDAGLTPDAAVADGPAAMDASVDAVRDAEGDARATGAGRGGAGSGCSVDPDARRETGLVLPLTALVVVTLLLARSRRGSLRRRL